MFKRLFLFIVAITAISTAIGSNSLAVNDLVDSIKMQKKQDIQTIIAYTDQEIEDGYRNNYIVVLNEIRKDAKSSKSIFIMSDKTPKSYSKTYNSRLYSSKEWEKYEYNMIKHYWLYIYKKIMEANKDVNKDLSDNEQHQINRSVGGIAVKLVERYFLPNFRISFINNLNNGGIQISDLPLVLETLAELADPTATADNQNNKIYNVDEDIPVNYQKNEKTYAIIIANERYDSEEKVECALNDGQTFKKYCQLLLGVPDANIHYIANATLNDFIYELDWLNDICNAYKGETNVIFYYAGHGYPGESDGSAYLLPVDGTGKNLRTCLKVEELYDMLAALPSQKVAVFLDACFSGVKRNGTSLNNARGVAIKVKQNTPKGNVIVFSAAQDDETAYAYRKGKHGLFTYYLLRKLKETAGEVTYGELSTYIMDQVVKTSIKENGKKQTPCTIPSTSLSANWKKIKIK